MRNVLIIPRDEIERHLAGHPRGDLKVVAPRRLDVQLAEELIALGKVVSAEAELQGETWRASTPAAVVQASELHAPASADSVGPFAISFALPRADQSAHHHDRHWELYYSESAMSAWYRVPGQSRGDSVDLPKGGVLAFGPGVSHKLSIAGLTLVIETPCVNDDRVPDSE